MKLTNDIYEELRQKDVQQLHIDAGYKTLHGRYFVELRNVMFLCDKDYVVPDREEYEEVSTLDWYYENYWSIIEPQFNNLISILKHNKNSRRGILSYYDHLNEQMMPTMICTMYTNCRIINDTLEYVVHMRSSDAIEYQSDIRWHKHIASKISKELLGDPDKFYIIWCADSFHMYCDD